MRQSVTFKSSANGSAAPSATPEAPATGEGAPATAATAATETTEAASDPADALVDAMMADMGGIANRTEPDEPQGAPSPEAESEPEADAAPEKDEQEKEPEAEAGTAQEQQYDDFADDKPWTAERLKSGAQQLRTARRQLQGWHNALDARETRLERQQEKHNTEKREVKILHERLAVDVNALFNGTPEQSLEALGRIRGKSPEQAYEELSYAILGKRKSGAAGGQPNDETRQMLAKVLERLDGIEAGATESRAAGERTKQIRACVNDAPGSWPLVAAALAGDTKHGRDPVAVVEAVIKSNGFEKLDIDSVFDKLERELRKQQTMASGEPTSRPAGSGPGAEREPAVKSPKQQAQSRPGRTVTPALSTESGGRRVKPRTEKEKRDAFARAVPDVILNQLSNIGG